MRTAFRCVASRNRERGRGPRDEASQSPVGAQPSRGESISFLSPAQAAGAPTFCDATESRQRTQPRGFPPPWLTPAFSDHPPENVRPCAHPFEAVYPPGWRAQRHRGLTMTGRSPRLRRPATYIANAMIAAPAGSGPKNNQPPFSAHCRLEETEGRRHPRRKARCRSARESSSEPAPAERATSSAE